MSDLIEQNAEEARQRWIPVSKGRWNRRAFHAGYRAAWEDANAAEIDGEAWQAENARLKAERDEALKELQQIAEWCETHVAMQDEGNHSAGPYATLEHRFRWACIVIDKLGQRAREVMSARGQEVRKVSVPPEILSRKALSPRAPADDGLLHDSPQKDIGRGRPAKTVRQQDA